MPAPTHTPTYGAQVKHLVQSINSCCVLSSWQQRYGKTNRSGLEKMKWMCVCTVRELIESRQLDVLLGSVLQRVETLSLYRIGRQLHSALAECNVWYFRCCTGHNFSAQITSFPLHYWRTQSKRFFLVITIIAHCLSQAWAIGLVLAVKIALLQTRHYFLAPPGVNVIIANVKFNKKIYVLFA